MPSWVNSLLAPLRERRAGDLGRGPGERDDHVLLRRRAHQLLGIDVGGPVEVGHGVPLRRHPLVVERDELAAVALVVPQEDPLGVVGDELDARVDLGRVGKLRIGHRSDPPFSVSDGGLADAREQPAEQRLPCVGVGRRHTGCALQQHAEADTAHEEQHGFRIDIGREGAVGNGGIEQRLRDRTSALDRVGDRLGDLRLAARADECLEANRLVVGQRTARHLPHPREQIRDPCDARVAEPGDVHGSLEDRGPQQVVLRRGTGRTPRPVDSPASRTMSMIFVPA